MRQIADEQGRSWEPVAVPQVVAHLRTGAVLGFRPAESADAEPIRTTIEFNSPEAADLAIRTMSERELRRRLHLARAESGVG